MAYELDYFGADELPPGLDDVRAGRAVLTSGDKGEGVVYVQALVGAIADGIYGPSTVAAVKAFQAAHGLTADGVVGQKTMAVLDQLAGRAPSIPMPVMPVASSKSNGVPKGALAEPAGIESAKKKTSPWVYAGIALGGTLAVGGGLWVATK